MATTFKTLGILTAIIMGIIDTSGFFAFVQVAVMGGFTLGVVVHLLEVLLV